RGARRWPLSGGALGAPPPRRPRRVSRWGWNGGGRAPVATEPPGPGAHLALRRGLLERDPDLCRRARGGGRGSWRRVWLQRRGRVWLGFPSRPAAPLETARERRCE